MIKSIFFDKGFPWVGGCCIDGVGSGVIGGAAGGGGGVAASGCVGGC
jgi:hypothetical protein